MAVYIRYSRLRASRTPARIKKPIAKLHTKNRGDGSGIVGFDFLFAMNGNAGFPDSVPSIRWNKQFGARFSRAENPSKDVLSAFSGLAPSGAKMRWGRVEFRILSLVPNDAPRRRELQPQLAQEAGRRKRSLTNSVTVSSNEDGGSTFLVRRLL